MGKIIDNVAIYNYNVIMSFLKGRLRCQNEKANEKEEEGYRINAAGNG